MTLALCPDRCPPDRPAIPWRQLVAVAVAVLLLFAAFAVLAQDGPAIGAAPAVPRAATVAPGPAPSPTLR